MASKTSSESPQVPPTMKAAAADRFGPPSVLRLHTLPVPKPGPDQVLIAVDTAGVGVWDASIRDGSWRPGGRTRFPVVPGTDGSGVIVAKGNRVRRFRIGDRVCASAFGFYQEYIAVDTHDVVHLPPPLDLLHAGAGTITGITALLGIDDALHIRSGETVLIFGASGAVGTLAVQFAKRRKARVLATASGKDALTLVRRLGADAVIDVRKSDAIENLRKLAPEGIDAALALAASDQLERCLDLVRKGGRIAYPNGVEPGPRHRPRIRVVSYDAKTGPRQFAQFTRAVAETKLRVPIAASYPLAQAAKAHARLARGHILGRIVLRINPKTR